MFTETSEKVELQFSTSDKVEAIEKIEFGRVGKVFLRWDTEVSLRWHTLSLSYSPPTHSPPAALPSLPQLPQPQYTNFM